MIIDIVSYFVNTSVLILILVNVLFNLDAYKLESVIPKIIHDFILIDP
jgi:hypothetical protein